MNLILALCHHTVLLGLHRKTVYSNKKYKKSEMKAEYIEK